MKQEGILEEVNEILASTGGLLNIYTIYGSPSNNTAEIVGIWPREMRKEGVESFIYLLKEYSANSGFKNTEIQKQEDPGCNLLIISAEWEDGTVYQLNIT